MQSWLQGCWQQGAVLIGISAGAIHLTWGISAAGEPRLHRFGNFFEAITLVHEESKGWPGLDLYKRIPEGDSLDCIQIPMGSGVWIQHGRATTFGRQASIIRRKASIQSVPYYP